jgi:hypothetical protein
MLLIDAAGTNRIIFVERHMGIVARRKRRHLKICDISVVIVNTIG